MRILQLGGLKYFLICKLVDWLVSSRTAGHIPLNEIKVVFEEFDLESTIKQSEIYLRFSEIWEYELECSIFYIL